MFQTVLAIISTLAAGVLGFLWWSSRTEIQKINRENRKLEEGSREQASELKLLRDQISPIESLQAEKQKLQNEVNAFNAALGRSRDILRSEIEVERTKLNQELDQRKAQFQDKYQAALSELERVTKEIQFYEEKAEILSFGLYKPFYDFDTPEGYKKALDEVREKQATMLKEGGAAICTREWTIDGDRRKGKEMTERNLKLMLRAFNGDCDAAIARVRFNNVTAIEDRIKKAFEAINKLGEPNACRIQSDYLELKLAELRLTHEQAEKVQAEKERQREIKEQLREEEIALREIEKAKKEAEKEEQRYEAALEKARAQMESMEGEKRRDMESKIAELERQLTEAHRLKERAKAQAELTKSGHVYVISNIGSFGEGVFKIGMTRRLEPMDRIKELGDASVPFAFDVHAMIFAEDAPALENALHRALADKSVNLVNMRKEFFSVTIEEIEEAARRVAPGQYEFVKIPLAEEYWKTQAMKLSGEKPVEVEPGVLLFDEEQDRFKEMQTSMADW